MPATYICTWIYGDPEGQESQYSQVPGRSSDAVFQAAYWRCVAVFFATSTRLNPTARHLLFTNLRPPEHLDGFALAAFLAERQVEIVTLPYTYCPPDGYYGAWRNQFYVFDCIRYLAEQAAPTDRCLLLDSDCLFVHPADALLRAIDQHGLLTYDIGLPPGWPQNGLTPEEMQQVYADLLGRAVPDLPKYYGGEFFAATGRDTACIAESIPDLWQTLLARHAAGLPKFNEEAHALSYLYYTLGYADATANPFIKRIWTGLLYGRNVTPADLRLAVWHLPTEKRYGIRRVFAEVARPGSAFWQAAPGTPAYVGYMSRRLGVPRRTPAKLALDLRDALREKGGVGAVASSVSRAVRQNLTHAARHLRDHLRAR